MIDVTGNMIIESIKQRFLPNELDKNEWYDFSFMFKILDDGSTVTHNAILSKSVADTVSDDFKACQDYYKKTYKKEQPK